MKRFITFGIVMLACAVSFADDGLPAALLDVGGDLMSANESRAIRGHGVGDDYTKFQSYTPSGAAAAPYTSACEAALANYGRIKNDPRASYREISNAYIYAMIVCSGKAKWRSNGSDKTFTGQPLAIRGKARVGKGPWVHFGN